MKRFKIILFVAVLISSVSCKKGFLDINRNPNTVTESSITAELILPNAMHAVGVQTSLGYGWLNNWIGYWSPSGSFSPSTEEQTYNITTTFGQGKWNGIYDALFDLHNVEVKAQAAGQSYYRAAAMILKAHLFQNLVDIFGDVPYSQAFDPTNPTPKYDKGEDIYKDLQIKLDTAVNLLKNLTVTTSSPIRTIDVIFQGNNTLWVKLANTLKLRLLIRQTQVPGFSPNAELPKIIANGGVLLSGESAEVHLAYVNDVGKQNPYYATYGKQPSGTAANEFFRANNYILNILKSNNDPRLAYFFAPATAPASAANPFIGTTYGAPPDVAFAGDKTSNIGPGLAKSASQAQWIVTSVESLFLRAEAVARGWLPGSAKAAYEDAVRESFIWLGVPNAVTAANTYMTTATNANWANAGATVSSQVAFIITQKYIALTGINPLEAWNDYRRLGIEPKAAAVSVNPARIASTIPIRLPYPASEFAVNTANAVSINQFTSPVFWDK